MSHRVHPVTGKSLTRGVRIQTVRHGTLSQEVSVPGWYPEDGSDSIHTGADLERKEVAQRELRSRSGA